MKRYELIREVYDMCSGKPNSQIQEIETEDLDAYVRGCISKASTCEKQMGDGGSAVYEVMTNGLRERYTFTEC